MNKQIAFGRSLNLLKYLKNSSNTKKNQYNQRKPGRKKIKKNQEKPRKNIKPQQEKPCKPIKPK